jgi:hypothetical protein
MIPTTSAGFLAFLLMVLPGLLFELIRDSGKPAAERSPFREICWVAIIGITATTLSIIVVALIARIQPDWFPDVRSWALDSSAYQKIHFELLLRTTFIVVALGCMFAVFASFSFRHRDKRNTVPVKITTSPALFNALFLNVKGHEKLPLATVIKRDGSRILGVVVEHDPKASQDQGWLVLEGGLRSFNPTNDPEITTEQGWQRVAVPYSEISELWIRFIDKTNENC